MKDFTFYSKFILRTPQNPISKIDDFEKEYKSLSIENEDSLFLASPSLLSQMLESKDRSLVDQEKLKLSYYKYWTRSHMRCTPYGLFANCQLGKWDKESELLISDQKSIQRHTSLDMNFLCALGKHLESHEDIQSQLEYFPNTSIYYSNQRYRFIFYTFDDKNNRSHRLNAVDENDYVNKILSKAKNGATLDILANEILDDDIDLEMALPYAKQFVEAQLLISNFEVAIAGQEYLDQILAVLNTLKTRTVYITAVTNTLIELKAALKTLDHNIHNRKTQYDKVIEVIKRLTIPYDISKLFQTNSFKKNDAQPKINYSIKKDLKACLNYLSKLFSSSSNRNLTEFSQKFTERYGDKRIKLLDVLDVESGLGYPVANNSITDNPIVEGIPNMGRPNHITTIYQDKSDRFLQKIIRIANYENLNEIDLKQDKWKADLYDQEHIFPPTIMFMGSFLGRDDNNKEQFQLHYAGGRSAINLLSRFAHGSVDIFGMVSDLVNHEKEVNKDQLIAEIIHLPQSRTGNILMHPTFFDYEICFLAKNSVTPGNVISLNEIEVVVEPGSGKISLWSEKHKKNILTRLSNAHNYSSGSLPIYQFLSDLQYQDYSQGLIFNWRSLNNIHDYFPRLKYGNIVISPQKWVLKPFILEEIKDCKKSKSQYAEINEILDDLNLPEQFLLVEGDNKILIERKKSISIDMFLKTIKKKQEVRLEEFLFSEYEGGVKDKNSNNYTNEIIGAIINKKGAASNRINNRKFEIEDTFLPGSEWIYYKIYLGVKTIEYILTKKISPLVLKLLKEKKISSWFFIRYSDPNFHLRLRFKLTDLQYLGEVISVINNTLKPLIEKQIIHSVMLDTYVREVARYGEQTMGLSEQLFYYDSESIVSFISSLDGDDDEDYRWKYVISSIDQLLSNFDFDLGQKIKILNTLQDNFGREFGMNKFMKINMDKKFRDKKTDIENLISRKNTEQGYEEIYQNVTKKYSAIAAICIEIKQILLNEEKQIELNNYLSSQIHMICNRLFLSNSRFHEFVIYYLMWKYYKTTAGKLKYYKQK